jgi:uncharacterized phiE125 gp8 family phage protein
MSSLRLIEPPVAELLTLEDAKEHLRVDFDDDDALIQSYIDAAVSMLDGRDGILQRALAPQTWALDMSRFPFCREIELPLPQLLGVESVEYLDVDGAWQTMPPEDYEVVTGEDGLVIAEEFWPPTQRASVAVTITFRAGYALGSDGEGEAPPPQLRQLLKLLVMQWYANREPVVIGSTVNNLPFTAQAVIANLRVYR